jgi:hypothetical protein
MFQIRFKFYTTFSFSNPKNSNEIKAKDKMKGTIFVFNIPTNNLSN